MSASLSRVLFCQVLVIVFLLGGPAMATPSVTIKELSEPQGPSQSPPDSLLLGLDWQEPAPRMRVEMLAAAGLKLPTTWDYVAGFTKGGIDAWRTVQRFRGNRAGTPIRGRRYQGYYDPHPSGFYVPQHDYPRFDPDPPHHPPFDPPTSAYYDPPANPLPPSNMIPSNPPPDFGPRAGEIRVIDERFDPTRASAIVNPASTNRTLRYLLDGEPVELPPGHYQLLGFERSWKIEFDRGGSFGKARYSIGNGLFTFTPEPHGWELVRRPK